MGRPKNDNRRRINNKTRLQKATKRSNYNNYRNSKKTLEIALAMDERGRWLRDIEKATKVPRSTIAEKWKQYESNVHSSIDDVLNKSVKRVLLSKQEEDSVVQYCLWQNDRGMNLGNHWVKAIIRDIHSRAVQTGELRQPINMSEGPSAKFKKPC